MTVTRAATVKDFEEDQSPWIFCSEAIKRAFMTMLDCGLFAAPSFIIVALGAFFTFVGQFSPFVYTAPRAHRSGMEERSAYLLLSVMGVASLIGRIVSGLIVTAPHCKAHYVTGVMLSVCGVAVMSSNFSFNGGFQIFCAAVFGACIGKWWLTCSQFHYGFFSNKSWHSCDYYLLTFLWRFAALSLLKAC